MWAWSPTILITSMILLGFFLYFVLCCPNGNFPMGNLGCIPQGKPAATVLRYPNLINHNVHAGSFCVSVIHQTLTWWTTGSLLTSNVHTWSWGYGRLMAKAMPRAPLQKSHRLSWRPEIKLELEGIILSFISVLFPILSQFYVQLSLFFLNLQLLCSTEFE